MVEKKDAMRYNHNALQGDARSVIQLIDEMMNMISSEYNQTVTIFDRVF